MTYSNFEIYTYIDKSEAISETWSSVFNMGKRALLLFCQTKDNAL